MFIECEHVSPTIFRVVYVDGRNEAQGHPSEDVQKGFEVVRQGVRLVRTPKPVCRHELPRSLLAFNTVTW